ncbi:MAG: hypothetical protein J6D33_10750 [Turicibacter sp.]|nr:hypothetical protein [Turicibacter sp.]
MEVLNYCDEEVIRFMVTSSRGLSTKRSTIYMVIDVSSDTEIDQDTLENIKRYNQKKVLPYLVPIHECIEEIYSNVLQNENSLLINLKRKFTSYMALRKINRELRIIEQKDDELKYVLSLVGLDEIDYLKKRKLIQELRESDKEYIRQLKELISNYRKQKEYIRQLKELISDYRKQREHLISENILLK